MPSSLNKVSTIEHRHHTTLASHPQGSRLDIPTPHRVVDDLTSLHIILWPGTVELGSVSQAWLSHGSLLNRLLTKDILKIPRSIHCL